MNKFGEQKQTQYKKIFFTLKTLILFFCGISLFQYFFSNSANGAFDKTNFSAIITSILIILLIVFLWFIMNLNYKKHKSLLYIEVISFFTICTSTVVLSGANISYYKFLFLYIIITYTLQFGLKTGLIISSISAVILMTIDLALYDNSVTVYFQNDLALSAIFLIVSWVLGFYVNTEKTHIANLEDITKIDGLTGLYNHRYFHEYMNAACKKSTKTHKPLSLIMTDVDYFKTYNDTLGHQKGDSLLKEIAALLKVYIIDNSAIFRYGGDEFCIVLQNTDEKQAEKVANKLRKEMMSHTFDGVELIPNYNLSMSMGISQYYYDSPDSFMQVIARADKALYKAKYLRKDRVQRYDSIFEMLDSPQNHELLSNTNVKSLISILNARDMYTYTHTERVVSFCNIFADYLELDADKKRILIQSAYLHDLGKINVSKEILISNSPLGEKEWSELKKHPIDSAKIVYQLGQMDEVADIVKHHHERYDGTGYPDGLAGEEIPYLSRILTIIDSFDAMTNTRPYQKIKTWEEAFDNLRELKNKQFDPNLVDPFIDAVNRC